MCPNIFSILREPPFKRLIKLFLCWQVSFLFLFIFTAAAAASRPQQQSPLSSPPLQATRFICLTLPQPGAGSRAPKIPSYIRGTHTLCHTLLHRLVSIINRLARQEACAAASHREASRGVAGGIYCCLLGVRDLAYLIIMSRAFSCSDDADADDDYSNTNTPDGSTHPFPSACPRRWLRDDGSMLGLRLPLSLRMIDGFCGTQLL